MLNYLQLLILKNIGINDPQTKMIIIRLILALYSLLVIYYSYKITELLSNSITAYYTALLNAILWFMPFVSVHNFVEVVCLPPLMYSIYKLLPPFKNNIFSIILAGFVGGIAISFRYQTSLILLGIIAFLFLKKKYQILSLYTIGIIFSLIVFQGLIDYIFLGKPFTVSSLINFLRRLHWFSTCIGYISLTYATHVHSGHTAIP